MLVGLVGLLGHVLSRDVACPAVDNDARGDGFGLGGVVHVYRDGENGPFKWVRDST